MISLYQFRQHAYPLLKISAKTGMTIEIIVDRKVYQLSLKELYKEAKTPYKPRPNKRKKPSSPHTMKDEGCSVCGELMVNGLCLNIKCPSAVPETYYAPSSPQRDSQRDA